MKIFKTDNKIFWQNQIKSWFLLIAFSVLAYFISIYFFPTNTHIVKTFIVTLYFFKLSDNLTQFHITEIQINKQANQLIFILKSRLSGEKIMKYELEQAKSEITTYSGLRKYNLHPYVLKIFLKPKDSFRITSKYGFTKDTLLLIDSELKL
jgi:hypothetical protein